MPTFFPRPVIIAIFFASGLMMPAARAHADSVAPSLALPTDVGSPFVAYGASTDAVAAIQGTYALRLDLALGQRIGRYVSASLRPGWHRGDVGEGPALGVSLGLHPQGRGLDGALLAMGAEGRWHTRGQQRGGGIDLVLEAGYLWTWKGLLIGATLGTRWRGESRWRPTGRLLGGWSWS